MQFKKLAKVFLPIPIVLIFLLGFTACDEEHTHAFSDWETVTEATCFAEGLQKRACSCGYIELGAINALSHTPVTDPSVEATCTTYGKTEGSHCSVCKAVIVAQTETAPLAHSFSAWETVAEATCTAHGLQKQLCSCGHAEYRVTDKIPHAPVADPSVAATCTTYGKTEGSHCSVCKITIIKQELILPLGHNCSQEVIIEEPACDKNGVKRIYCTNENCEHYCEEAYSLADPSAAEIYANACEYTGCITTYDRLGNYIAEMMGVVISSDGKILTSNLMFDDAFSAVFKLGDAYFEVTEVLAYSTENNIAVLKIDATDLPFANLCYKEHLAGETVYSFGTVENAENTMIKGIITNPNSSVGSAVYIQHDINIRSGLIGSPLINKFGEVIGVNVGVLGDSLNFSTPAHEIDKLNYENPMTLAEYGALTYTNQEQLADWVNSNYNNKTTDKIYYSIGGSNFRYSLGYDLDMYHCFIDGLWTISANEKLYVYIILNPTDGVYEYRAEFISGNDKNTTCGFFEAASFNKDTILTYDTFHGKYWQEDLLMKLYSSSVYNTFEWFSYCLDAYFDNLTLESFGFEALCYERDADALDKLNALVKSEGEHNESTGEYVLSYSTTLSTNNALFEIVHTPQNGDVAASTVVTVYLSTSSNAIYAVSIALDPTENGYRFDTLYAEFNGSNHIIKNAAWGYMEPDTFTDTSRLEVYLFSGLEDYEDTFLKSYSYLSCELLSWLNVLMESADEALSVKDLGFLFFLG